MSKTPHTDQRYIEALLNNDDRVIKEIYEKWYETVLGFVHKNNGNEQDAADLFQDALMAIIRRARKGDFVLIVPFGSYFRSVYRSIWIDKLRKNSREKVIKEEVQRYTGKQDSLAQETVRKERQFQLYMKCFNQLSEKCQELLRLTFQKIPRKKIA